MLAECSTVNAQSDDLIRLDDELRRSILAQLRGPERPTALGVTDVHILCYTRVSKSVQESLPDQKRAIDDDVARFGWEVERHRWDVGSRWDDTRPDYRELHRDIESRHFTHLWAFKADRLGGDDQEFVALIRKAQRYGMVVRDTINGEISEDMAMILGLQSYWEIKNNHYRVVLKLEGKHLEGVKLGSYPPGYRPQCRMNPCRCGLHGKHLPHEPQASLVRDLFRRYAAGESLGTLRRWWNAETGDRRVNRTLKDLLANPYYVGIVVNCRTHCGRVKGRRKRDKGEWKMGTHEHPLVDLPTFATVQERLRTQENVGQERTARPRHPMVGLIHCVGCGCRMHARFNGGSSTMWECPLCKLGRSQRKVDKAVVGLLAAMPFPEDAAVEDYAQQQARMQHALSTELAAIDAERDREERRRSVWADDRGDGTMSKDAYRTKMAESDRRLEELRQQQAALQDSHIAQPGRAALLSEVRDALRRMGNWTETIARMTPDELRGLYRALIKAVKLDLAAGRMTVDYTDALARWCGRASDTVPLPSQKVKGVG